jgi:SAM-dependent methyltransferase
VGTPATTQPPDRLATRVGGSADGYREIAEFHRERILSLLPAGWTWEGKRVLDFGCGPGRTLSEFSRLAPDAEFFGCDIHDESIAWAREHLGHLTFVKNGERPPLELPSGSFDLVYGISVFTHLTEHWAAWLAEIHRLLRPGGLGIFSFLGEAMWQPFGAGELADWVDDETGMLSTRLGRSWDEGGPNVFHSEWWLREHWGRGFEIVELRPRDTWRGVEGHGWVVLRRGEGALTPEELERIDSSEPREALSMARNLKVLMRESRAHAEQVDGLRAEIAQLGEQLGRVYSGRSWRVTAPLRAAAGMKRRLSVRRR